MALSDDLRERVVGAVVEGGMSRNAAAKRFGVSIAPSSANRFICSYCEVLLDGRGEAPAAGS